MKPFVIKNPKLNKTNQTATKASQVPQLRQLKLPTKLDLKKGLTNQIPISQIQPTMQQFSRHNNIIAQKSKQQILTDEKMQKAIQKKLNTDKTTSTRYEEEEIYIKPLAQSEVNINNFDDYVKQIEQKNGKNAVNGQLDNLCRNKLAKVANTTYDINEIINKFRNIYYELIQLAKSNLNTSNEDTAMYKFLFEFITMLSSNITKSNNIDEQLIYPFIISKIPNITNEWAKRIQILMQDKITNVQRKIYKLVALKNAKEKYFTDTLNQEIEKNTAKINTDLLKEIQKFTSNTKIDAFGRYAKNYIINEMLLFSANDKDAMQNLQTHFNHAFENFINSSQYNKIKKMESDIRELRKHELMLEKINYDIQDKLIERDFKLIKDPIKKNSTITRH
ncbi:hypothetical protein [Candidatus Deianiraea vastatrix]|uniref:Uncharacterized protein n=1 Tax=Candidatus Deianiraea vastatrix TaxID=2163644 RepID=A0A5B8XD29_9RICK|nr:hypothetical protein [Candidatus Deianiraea vastatrix]QED23213.1 hypothetical protein Deia_00410 [Candidatus Deianiraea vastatrix]